MIEVDVTIHVGEKTFVQSVSVEDAKRLMFVADLVEYLLRRCVAFALFVNVVHIQGVLIDDVKYSLGAMLSSIEDFDLEETDIIIDYTGPAESGISFLR